MSEFAAHVALLDEFLTQRRRVVERIESTLLNVRGRALAQSRHRAQFDRQLNACFFGLPGLPAALSSLRGRLHARHVADGFEPVQLDRYSNELDPLDLIVRAYEYWESHRWPGFTGRLAYAQTLYAVFMLRQLEALSLCVWDDGTDRAGGSLASVQALLDRLNASGTPSAFVCDARWLMQTAQGPFTRHLAPYFDVATRMSASFTDTVRLGMHKAAARLAGGHLRSQLRYRVWSTHRPIDDPENLTVTRNSNAMDGALLIRDLVPLLEAYAIACDDGLQEERHDLADAILQGVSADPELFLERLDLLGPCTSVEDLFLEEAPEGGPRFTDLGLRHRELLSRYGDLIGQLAASLTADAQSLDPSQAAYSPLGITYGFCADVLSNMAIDSLVSHSSFDLSLEDIFVSRGRLDDKLARAAGWTRLPQRAGEREHFDHSRANAAENFARLMAALDARCQRPRQPNASRRRDARIVIQSHAATSAAAPVDPNADWVVADAYCVTTDVSRAAPGRAAGLPLAQLLLDRKEGRYLASAECDGAWFGLSKVVLTLVVAQGRDAVVTDVPEAVVDRLRLTCPGLLR